VLLTRRSDSIPKHKSDKARIARTAVRTDGSGLVTTRCSVGSSPKRVTTVCSNRCELARPVEVSKDPRQWAPRLPGLHARLTYRPTRTCQPRSAEPLVGEHERIVGKLNGRQFLRVHHHLERFNPLTYRGGNRRIGGRGRPYSEPNRDQSGGKGKQGGLAHLSSPVQSAQPHHAVAQAV
jgi:hypothetical protein